MLASGPQEVPGATHAGIGLTQTESVLCVGPKPPYVNASQLYTTSAVTSAEQVSQALEPRRFPRLVLVQMRDAMA